MQERNLPIRAQEDPTPVELDAKQKEKLLKTITDLHHAVGYLHERVSGDTLDQGMMGTMLSLSEYHLTDICTALNYEGVLKKDMEQRTAQIRSLNIENRELRQQLGMKVSNEDARERLKLIVRSVRDWWNEEGLGHLSDVAFSDYGTLKIKFSGHVFGKRYGDSPKTEADMVAALSAKGLTFIQDGSSDFNLADTDANKELLTQIFKTKYPSLTILSYLSWVGNRKGPTIREFDVIIHDLNDIEIADSTPQPNGAGAD